MYPQPPLLIIAPIADDFDLAQLPWCDAAREKVSVNRAKFKNLEIAEVIVDAMPHQLTRLTADETREKLAFESRELLGGNPSLSGQSAIAVAPGDNLTSARHLPEVHRRLLLLGKWIGESLQATAAAWTPSRKLASFAWFDGAVAAYLAEDRFPSLFHTSFSEVGSDQFATKGLSYFTGQEIRLTFPSDYDRADVRERIAQIIADVAAHGLIDQPSRSESLILGETLLYRPGDNPEQIDIIIRRDEQESSRQRDKAG